jgi:single-strand DNA-binding protein
MVLVTGRLRADENGNPRTYERKDGTTGASFEVTADNVRFLGGKGDSVEAPEQNTDEEIPF